jgi:hypothetical protein
MSDSPRLVTLGSINSGGISIQADVTNLGSAVAVAVTLSTNYTLANPRPPAFPVRPSWTGVAVAAFDDVAGAVIASGTVLEVLQAEATALINAGAATLT